MEILETLEHKVKELLNEVSVLRKRNRELENRLSQAGEAEGAGRTAELVQALEKERKLRGDVLKRIEILVSYLEEHNSAG
ncbi:MAG: hypothetical protein FWF99_02990 [Desulfovibrionaceae bacterium]|nr:hypothetical protein [Desulfovibrionaceae bacterium]